MCPKILQIYKQHMGTCVCVKWKFLLSKVSFVYHEAFPIRLIYNMTSQILLLKP